MLVSWCNGLSTSTYVYPWLAWPDLAMHLPTNEICRVSSRDILATNEIFQFASRVLGPAFVGSVVHIWANNGNARSSWVLIWDVTKVTHATFGCHTRGRLPSHSRIWVLLQFLSWSTTHPRPASRSLAQLLKYVSILPLHRTLLTQGKSWFYSAPVSRNSQETDLALRRGYHRQPPARCIF